jgi:CBS domain-containing protein
MQTQRGADGAMYGFLGCTVRQFMTRAVVTVTRQTTMRELEGLFERHDFNAFPVVEHGKVIGIISKFDFLHAFAFTTGHVVPPRVLQLMVSLKIRSFPVMNANGQLEGIISREDIMRALKETTQESP